MISETATGYVSRQKLLRKAMAAIGLDALLITGEKDIRYLTGFLGHDSLLIVWAGGGAAIVSDPRYDEFLDPWKAGELADVVMGVRHRLEATVADLTRGMRAGRLGVQAESLTVARRAKLAAAGDFEIIETTGLVGRLRMTKDPAEVALIERAIRIQQEALDAALARVSPGMSEMHLCAILEFEMKTRGSEAPSFDTMISSGARSSVIHYQTSDKPIEEGVLLIDWGATVQGYHSDLTRTFSIGPMPEKVAEVYSIVHEAQTAAIEAIRPGRTCAQIDEVARAVIRGAGFGEFFGHGLGHGLGMDTHEPPFFNELQTDVVLEPGMVMTVEPGIYLPGVGGVRIEDDVLVTETGSRVLSTFPKELEAAELNLGRRRATTTVGARGTNHD